MSPKGVVFHLPADWLGAGADGLLPFYRRLFKGFDRLGVPHRAVPIDRDTALATIEADEWFHILNHARIPHPRALMAGIAYVYPFWNLDPQGIRAFSSIGDKPFRAARIDRDKARDFLEQLRRRWVVARTSRYEQPQEPSELPEGAVAVFFQSEAHRIVGETCFMDRWTMLETVLRSVDGPVVVKPHPRELDTDLFDRLLALQAAYPSLSICQGNIHDILATCSRVVTINSAVGIEAYMHRKPVILCGRADFHHIADQARDPEALTALLRSPPRGRVYAKYLYWYFVQNCVNAGRPDLPQQVLKRIRATGFSIDADL